MAKGLKCLACNKARKKDSEHGRFCSRSCQNIHWIESACVVPDGKHVGKPVRLSKHQKKWVSTIYDTPTRRFILSVGKKNAKTTFAAMLLLLHLCGPEHRVNSQLYSSALSRDQAALLFALAAKMVRMSPELSDAVGVRDTAKELYCPELGTSYKALSAEASTAHGKSSVFVVHDELGQVRGPRSDLYDALETGVTAHDEPLSIIISTQAATDGDLLSIEIDDALSGADPKVKVVIYEADKDANPFLLKTIRQANPHLTDFMNKDEVMRMAREAKRMPSKEASFRNLILNQRVEAKQPFVPKKLWQENGEKPESLAGREVYGGLDLSAVNDLTSLVLVAPGEYYDVEPTFWLPEDGLREKSAHDRVPYDVWADQGYLETCPGRSVDYEWVAYRLREVFDDYIVKAIAFDRWGMRHLTPWLERAGFTEDELDKFVEFGQGYKDMSPALRSVESILLAGRFRHGNHPVLTMCAANAVVQQDPAGNRKLAKDRSSGRIDGMVSLAMATGSSGSASEEKPKAIKQGFVEV